MTRFGLLVSFLYAVVVCMILAGCGVVGPRDKIQVAVPRETMPQKKIATDAGAYRSGAPGASEPSESPLQTEGTPPQQVVPPARIVQVERVAMLPDLDQVNARLSVYGERIASRIKASEELASQGLDEGRRQELEQCARRVDEVYSAYSWLHQYIAQGQNSFVDSGTGQGDPYSVFQLDIDYLESGCDAVLKSGLSPSQGLNNLSSAEEDQAEMAIYQYAERDAYEDIISAFSGLKERFPEHKFAPDLKQIYGLALFRMGRLDDAIKAFLEALNDYRQGETSGVLSGRICTPVSSVHGALKFTPLSLQRLTADLLMLNGQLEQAEALYQELADLHATCSDLDQWVDGQLFLLKSSNYGLEELSLFRNVLKAYLSFDGQHVPPDLRMQVEKLDSISADSPFANRARLILKKLEGQVEGGVGEQLKMVDSLVDGKRYSDARAILEALLGQEIPQEMRDIVKNTLDKVVATEARDRETTQQEREQALSLRWDEANNLLDLQRYDDAISAFSSLTETDYDGKAREKIKEASDLAAAELRRTAANLFVKAGKTSQPDQKAELLLESHQMLRQILKKYPGASIVDKVLQNLAVLEEQIRKVDPTILDYEEKANKGDMSEGTM